MTGTIEGDFGAPPRFFGEASDLAARDRSRRASKDHG
jgi:hypothetical protein